MFQPKTPAICLQLKMSWNSAERLPNALVARPDRRRPRGWRLRLTSLQSNNAVLAASKSVHRFVNPDLPPVRYRSQKSADCGCNSEPVGPAVGRGSGEGLFQRGES